MWHPLCIEAEVTDHPSGVAQGVLKQPPKSAALVLSKLKTILPKHEHFFSWASCLAYCMHGITPDLLFMFQLTCKGWEPLTQYPRLIITLLSPLQQEFIWPFETDPQWLCDVENESRRDTLNQIVSSSQYCTSHLKSKEQSYQSYHLFTIKNNPFYCVTLQCQM